MTNIPEKAILIRKFSHATIVELILQQPEDPKKAKGWADADLQQGFEELGTGTITGFRFVSGMLLYDGAGYAYDCHLASLHTVITYLNTQIEKLRNASGVTIEMVEKMPARGKLKLDIRTFVPREIRLKGTTELAMYVNNEQQAEKDFTKVVAATNLAMVAYAGKVLLDIWQKGSAFSAEQPKSLS